MKVKAPGLQWYVDKINAGDAFTFIRYGDGEWSAIIGDGRQRTGSGSHALNLPAMQKQLRKSVTHIPFSDPCYIRALRPSAMTHRIEGWLAARKLHTGWHDCRAFYLANRKGQLNPFIEAIRQSERPFVVIGPPHMIRLRKILPVAQFVGIPRIDCFPVIGAAVKKVLKDKRPKIISISAGPPAKIIAFVLYQHIGEESVILDLGSLWDVYCGAISRRYHKHMTPDIIKRNLEHDR